jgi:hypothetical protein
MFERMKRSHPNRFWPIYAVAMGSVVFTALADIPANPYEAITTRNPFGLKPPPDPKLLEPPPTPAPPLQLADVTLTGMTSIFANKRALFEIIPAPGKPAVKAILGEGERIESVEVVAIDLDKNEVTIKNGPVLTNLTFKIAKSAPTAAPPPPGVANPAMFQPKVPPPQTTAFHPEQAGGRNTPMVAGGVSPAPPAPNVNPGVPPLNAGGAPAYGGPPAANTGLNDGLRTLPQRPIRSSAPQIDTQSPANPQAAEASRAVQYLQLRLSEEQARQQGKPFPPIPPFPGE